ncbi:MAG: FlgD immunoglobulin-like domain containing protein [Candidatus Marinimicrobia bacterium]|nr:FlgD immunoglobulin-like domain containing protein [Candidatus Neomarinimicrobiota bacterium]
MTLFSGIPGNRDVGENAFLVTAYDRDHDFSLSAYIAFIIENYPCEITSLPPLAILAGMDYEYDVQSSDEGEGAVYSLLEGPGFLAIHDSSGILSGTSANDDVGAHYVKIMVDDGNGSTDIQEWMLSILPANDDEEEPPVLREFPPFVFNEDDTSSLVLLDDYVEDADTPLDELQWFFIVNGNENIYAMLFEEEITPRTKSSVLGLNVLYNPETRELRFYGAPDWYGETMVTCVVTDGDRLAVGYISVTVLNVNDAPVLMPFTNVVFLEDEESAVYELRDYVQDIDDDFSSLSIELSGNTNIIYDLEDGRVRFSAPQDWNGQEGMVLSVSDTEYSCSCEFLVVVVPVNDPPQEFSLLAPASGSLVDTMSIEFRWETAHDVDIDDHINYTLIVKNSAQEILLETHTDITNLVWDVPGNDTYYWKIEARDLADAVTESESWNFSVNIQSNINALPSDYVLTQNHPNPFNPITRIKYGLPAQSDVRLIIYDISGRRIREWYMNSQNAGWHEVLWNGTNNSGHPVSTGVYICFMQAGDFTGTQKMVFMK